MMRRIGGRILGIVASVIFAACGGGDAPQAVIEDTDYGEPVSGGTAVIADLADMSIPISMLAETTLDGNLGGDVMNMNMLSSAWVDGRLVFETAETSPMSIARSYEYFGPDSASLRYHMRSDVLWSDGTPLTAADVVFTYSILGDPELASPLQGYVENLENVVAEDDSTVVFNFTHRFPEMLAYSALSPLPEHVYGETAPGEIRNHPTIQDPANGNLLVTGPYMIGSWTRGQQVVLVRNPHFQPAGYLDQVVIRVIPDPTTRLVELQTGGVDFVQGLPLDQIPRLREQAPNIRFETEQKRAYDYVGYNPEIDLFADPEVRKALGLAIDVDGIIRALQMEDFAVPAGGPYSPIFADLYDPEGQPPLPYDPDEARAILESKGWADSNGDGILDRDGRPFQFTLGTNAGNQRRSDVSQIIQQQWREIGVDAQLQQTESNTFFDNLENGNFEAALAGWSVALYPDLTAIWSPGSPFNFVSYDNPEVMALIERALEQPTHETANPIWREAASTIAADHPYTWLFYLDTVDGVNNRLRDTQVDTYGPYQNVWEWWIPESLRRGGE